MTIVDRLNAALKDRYRIERQLGEGGMARVFLAHDPRHDRPVAVKVLKTELARDVDATRFLAEIRTTANLQHPHILPLFDSGEADGLLFYVMPYVRGESLRVKLQREGALSVEESVDIAASVGEALEHAHRQGVLHRDIKPGNVMMSDGGPLLADFGIALALRQKGVDRLTRTGTSVGTPGYMSPEQAAGETELSARSDIYSLGALTYEMLTGRAPFGDLTPGAALAKVLTEDPPEPASLDSTIPKAVSDEVSRAMAKDPADRHSSARSFRRTLRAATSDGPSVSKASIGDRLTWVGVAVVAVSVLSALWLHSSSETRWARNEALPQVQRLLGTGETAEAFVLATRALDVLPDDPVLTGLYDAASSSVAFTSEPPGATVSYRPYDLDDTTWASAGVTPTPVLDLPAEELLLRFELAGHHSRLASLAPSLADTVNATLVPDDRTPVVPIDSSSYGMSEEIVELGRFWMDEFEVTNERYEEFLDAGLEWDPELWVEPFAERGIQVDLERMRAELVDATGRPGPAGWELSRPPSGRERHPVRGVSWFEAVAYCAFRGKELPTYYHWKAADAGSLSAWDGLLAHANLVDGSGPVPVGTTEAYSVLGVADLAGNVREWVWNAAMDGRYILGGSWNAPAYMYNDPDVADPWSRDPENGFRCVRYEAPLPSRLYESVEGPVYDFTGYEPVDDRTFASYASFYDYDRGPLNESRTKVSESDAWTRYRVEIDAAYLDERVPIHLFLPQGVDPPYQSVVYGPGGGAFVQTSSENVAEMSELMFIPESGRALLYPVLKGTYERDWEGEVRGPVDLRQRYVRIVQDFMRTMDFAEEDGQLANDKNAYLALSLSAELAVPSALEKRFEALVLIGAGLDPAWRGQVPEEVAPWNFVSRITTPTLLINGELDFMHPYEESQLPFFRMIDVPEGDKEFVLLPTGHVPPRIEVIRHTLRWLDERLAPVGRSSR